MKERILHLTLLLSFLTIGLYGQTIFDQEIEPDWGAKTIRLSSDDRLKTQILFIGQTDTVQTTPTYGNPAGQALAKEWHDFIGFTTDTTGESAGWISVNHEMVVTDNLIGDGGGMTAFRVKRDPETDTLIVMQQTLKDGREGKFFNVDFVNTVGETGMNCGGISSVVDGRIWTAEEWWRGSNKDLADRDTSDFIIGQGTIGGQEVMNGFPLYDGMQIKKYQNFNYMVEIDPREAVALRKQYNWGRQPFEGGAVLPDNKTVILGADETPGLLTKFVADEAGNFTTGTTYVYKQDGAEKWVEIDNSNLDNMLNFTGVALAEGATMFNRLEWVVYDPVSGDVYLCETGRDFPGGRFSNGSASGGTHAAHTLARAETQNTHPDSSDYTDYYGRVLRLDVETDEVTSFLEGGPFLEDGSLCEYPDVHLSNPDGLHVLAKDGKSYLLICEDLNGDSHGRTPKEFANFGSLRTCELYMLDIQMAGDKGSVEDLVRIASVPYGAEVTGVHGTPDGKTILFNSQHPDESNPFPYNHSLTIAITGWDQLLGLTSTEDTGLKNVNSDFSIYPNPAFGRVRFDGLIDVAVYDVNGKRISVHRKVREMDVSSYQSGVYFLVNGKKEVAKLIVQ